MEGKVHRVNKMPEPQKGSKKSYSLSAGICKGSLHPVINKRQQRAKFGSGEIKS